MAVDRKQQMKEITERLEQGVKDIFTSEIKSKTALHLRQKTSAFPFLPTRAFGGWNAGRCPLKVNSQIPNQNLIRSSRKLFTGSSISLKKAI